MRRFILLAAALLMPSVVQAQEPVRLYSAGSLRAAMTEIGAAFQKDYGIPVAATFGASGLLRERIEKGEPAEVFTSADTGHPTTLMRAGTAGPAVVFTRNRMCGLARNDFSANPDTLLDRMLDASVKLGTSTPKADPSGDYAWLVFERAEKLRSGTLKTLDAKAMQLTGGPNSPPPPANRNVYGQIVESKQADLFLTYCTNAVQAIAEVPSLKMIALPDTLTVGADYGLTLIGDARPAASRLVLYILSPAGQKILERHGFTPVNLPVTGS